MPGTNIQPRIIVDNIDEIHQVIEIIKRLSDSHHNDMADALVVAFYIHVLLNIYNLFNNFTAVQITILTEQTARTERKANITPNMSSHTKRQAVFKKIYNFFPQ